MALRPVLALALGTLALVPSATGAATTVGAAGVVTGPTSDAASSLIYTLTIANTGNEPILCWRFTPRGGMLVTGLRPFPAGWQQLIRGGRYPTDSIAGRSSTGIPPGGSAAFPFAVDRAYPDNAGGELFVSGNCSTDVAAAVTGPGPCRCTALSATIQTKPRPVTRGKGNVRSVRILLEWTMTCSAGSGGCEGELVLAPDGADIKRRVRVSPPREGKVVCRGRCATSTRRLQAFYVTGTRRSFGSRTVELVLGRVCGGRTLEPQRFWIAFDSLSRVTRVGSGNR